MTKLFFLICFVYSDIMLTKLPDEPASASLVVDASVVEGNVDGVC